MYKYNVNTNTNTNTRTNTTLWKDSGGKKPEEGEESRKINDTNTTNTNSYKYKYSTRKDGGSKKLESRTSNDTKTNRVGLDSILVPISGMLQQAELPFRS